MSFKKSISNKSLFLFCWLLFCVFMNSGPGHGNCKKNVNIDWQDWKSLRPYPHFKHLENNGVWCDWINEIAQTVKRAHILYINLIIFTWQKWKKRERRSRESRFGFQSYLQRSHQSGYSGTGSDVPTEVGLSLPNRACLAYISHGL